jgi:hypothetical protein
MERQEANQMQMYNGHTKRAACSVWRKRQRRNRDLKDLTVAESWQGASRSVRAPQSHAENEPEGDDNEYELMVPLTF